MAGAADDAATLHDTLFDQGEQRFVLFPLRLPGVWEAYKQQMACFWTVDEVDLATDVEHWKRLTEPERDFVKLVLAFFAASDGIVGENLMTNFSTQFEAPEVRCFYGFQTMMENIHSEMYSLLINTLIDDAAERDRLFNAVENYECVRKKADWAIRWMGERNATVDPQGRERPTALGERLVAFAAVEGIFFSCSFCAIFWLKKRGLMPGLCTSNEFISRDEGMHTNFACLMANMLAGCGMKPDDATITRIIVDAVDTERAFVREALRCDLIGINSDLMEQYLECVADTLLAALDVDPAYGTRNPFEWMTMISIEGKSNFFEKRVSEYRRPPAVNGFQVDDDF